MKVIIDTTDDGEFDGFRDVSLQAIRLIVEGKYTLRDNKMLSKPENFKNPQIFCDRHGQFEEVDCVTYAAFGMDDAAAREKGFVAVFDCCEWDDREPDPDEGEERFYSEPESD